MAKKQSRTETLQQEQQELKVLLNTGAEFEVKTRMPVVYKTKLFGLIKYRKVAELTRSFIIKQPTLAILDALSALWVEMDLTKSQLSRDTALSNARRMVKDHSRTAARVVAIAVLGESGYFIPRRHGNITMYDVNGRAVEELEELFLHALQPEKLMELALVVNAMCNFGDFISSIRLMSVERTAAAPDRIEAGTRD